MVHIHVSLSLQTPPEFWQITHCLTTHNQDIFKLWYGVFLQESCHKHYENWISVFWTWWLTSPTFFCPCSSCISIWLWIRVWNPWYWKGTRKWSIGLTTVPLSLAVVGGPVVPMILSIPFPWHFDIFQLLVAPHILNQTYQISPGESSWSLFVKSLGPRCW